MSLQSSVRLTVPAMQTAKELFKRESKGYAIYETTFSNHLLYVQQVLSNIEGFHLSFCTQPR